LACTTSTLDAAQFADLCSVGDKLFGNFVVTGGVASSAITAIPLSSSPYGLRFETAESIGGWFLDETGLASGAVAILNSAVSYTVSVIQSGLIDFFINQVNLSATTHTTGSEHAIATVEKYICLSGAFTSNDPVSGCGGGAIKVGSHLNGPGLLTTSSSKATAGYPFTIGVLDVIFMQVTEGTGNRDVVIRSGTGKGIINTFNEQPVPEPAVLSMAAIGLISLGLWGRFRGRRKS